MVPFGPSSLIWRYLGDVRYQVGARVATTLQVMHPAIGASVADPDLSVFFTEPIARVRRSTPLIMGVVYDGQASHDTADELRHRHAGITGVDENGKRYHALDPEVFYWAHATFMYLLFVSIEHFHAEELTPDEQEQLYQECCDWYRLYGLSGRPMPSDLTSFRAYLDRTVADELMATETALRGKAMFGDPRTIPQNEMPPWLWRIVAPPAFGFVNFMSRGLMPPLVRDKMDYSWTAVDERRFRRVAWVLRTLLPKLPRKLRYGTEARRAFERSGWPSR